ncbi:hypothetical protein GW17_00001636 [Ensete ventricosum]|nr:hypothetical protein GW17_00001636 [Ensete ventricosum]
MSTLRSWSLVSDITFEVSLPNEVLNMIFEVVSFLSVMSILLMEAIISSLVPSLGTRLDRIGRPEELLLLDGTPRISTTKCSTHWARDSSLPWLSPRSEATVGLGRALAKNFGSNSFMSWLNDEIKNDLSRLYHIRAGLLRVVGSFGHGRSQRALPEGRNLVPRHQESVGAYESLHWDVLRLHYSVVLL